MQTKTFGSLDGVRAFCCLWVVKAHAGWFVGMRLFDAPGLGVEMFFTISGFLIVTLLIREREKTGTVSLRNFYARRSLRIFPIYYGSILIVLLASSVLAVLGKPGPFQFYRWAIVVLLTYTQDVIPVNLGSFHPCWSLAVEEQFYLVWPTIEKLTSTGFRWAILIGVIVMSELVNFGVLRPLLTRIYSDPQAYLMPLFMVTFAPIAFGVCLAHILHHPRSHAVAYRIVGHRWAPLLWVGVLALIFHFAPEDMAGWPRLAGHLTVALLLASLVIREDNCAARLLKIPVWARIGAISYGLYLYHEWIIDYLTKPVDALIQHAGLTSIALFLRFVVIATVCILVAEVSFRFFEKPILRLRSRFQS